VSLLSKGPWYLFCTYQGHFPWERKEIPPKGERKTNLLLPGEEAFIAEQLPEPEQLLSELRSGDGDTEAR
jgi:hypothetical protein